MRLMADQSILSDYHISDKTVVFINNHLSNFSPQYWTNPDQYDPDRFLKEGRFKKPSHFLPFSIGRRSCIGYKIVQQISTALAATILRKQSNHLKAN